jgi:hypothetical protein
MESLLRARMKTFSGPRRKETASAIPACRVPEDQQPHLQIRKMEETLVLQAQLASMN